MPANWEIWIGLVPVCLAIWNVVQIRSFERFKVQLQRDHDHALENLRSNLRIGELERQLTMGTLLERRANVLEQIYSKLVATEEALIALTSLIEHSAGPSKRERAVKFWEAYEPFSQFFTANRIYISKELSDKIEAVLYPLRVIYFQFEVHVIANEKDVSLEGHKAWSDCWSDAMVKIPAMRAEIEAEFRSVLGAD